MSKSKLLSFISTVLFVFAFLLLIIAMIFHAVEGNDSTLSIVSAIISAISAFIGFVFVLISEKSFNEKY